MRKYIALFFSFFKASLMSDLEYRLNIVTKVFTDILWYAVQASVFEVLFYHAPKIAGWDISSARVFMAILFVVDSFWMILFHENFERLSSKIRKGDVDMVLTKPVDAQFILSLQKMNTSYVLNTVLTFSYLIWCLNQLPDPFAWWRLLLFITVGLPTAVLICYCFRLLFATLSMIFTNAEATNYIWYQIYRLGMRPDHFYPNWLRPILLSALPVAFVASVPTRLLLFELDWRLIVGGPVATAVLLFISRKCWQASLKHYASASS